MMSDSESWGFAVERTNNEKDYKESLPLPEPRFRVWLPHQCDKWEIVGDADTGDAKWYASQADALAELDRFIDEAIEAREALAKGAEYGDHHRHMF